jgi:hypothetical protein
MKDVPIEADARSVYDALSNADKQALRRADDIRERVIRQLYVRIGGHGGDIHPSELSDEARADAHERADAILVRLIGLTQDGLDDLDDAEI